MQYTIYFFTTVTHGASKTIDFPRKYPIVNILQCCTSEVIIKIIYCRKINEIKVQPIPLLGWWVLHYVLVVITIVRTTPNFFETVVIDTLVDIKMVTICSQDLS